MMKKAITVYISKVLLDEFDYFIKERMYWRKPRPSRSQVIEDLIDYVMQREADFRKFAKEDSLLK